MIVFVAVLLSVSAAVGYTPLDRIVGYAVVVEVVVAVVVPARYVPVGTADAAANAFVAAGYTSLHTIVGSVDVVVVKVVLAG